MADEAESWHAARLIPVSGINGDEEQERRATSALLAVLSSVREFGRGIVADLGGLSGPLETFIEVPFQLGDKRLYPDGLIRVSRGSKTWVALVEVKTGRNELKAEQIENYLDIARDRNFDAVLTISNQLPAMHGEHPTQVDKRKLKKVALHHLAWSQIHTEAILHKLANSVSDPDQAWILAELIRYLEHPKSGVIQFDDMGPTWVAVRDSVIAHTLRPSDPGARDVAVKWEQLVRFTGMALGRALGVEVPPAVSRKEASDPGIRIDRNVRSLVDGGILVGALKVPHTIGVMNVEADIRTGRVSCWVDVEAPREGRPQTRVNWLVRQLTDASADARIDTFTPYVRSVTCSELLSAVRESPGLLVDDQKRDIKSFRVTVTTKAGTKRGQGQGSFVDSVVTATESFYVSVVQRLKPWVPSAPKARKATAVDEGDPAVHSSLVSTALSSQDDEAPPARSAANGQVHDASRQSPSADEPPGGHPAAGWYVDPSDASRQRYWDGRAWTEHTAQV